MEAVYRHILRGWYASLAFAATLMVPFRLNVFRLHDGETARTWIAHLGSYLVTAGVSYFIGVFLSLPLLLLCMVIARRTAARIYQRPGLWAASAWLILSTLALSVYEFLGVAAYLATETGLILHRSEIMSFLYFTIGVGALTFYALFRSDMEEEDGEGEAETGAQAEMSPAPAPEGPSAPSRMGAAVAQGAS